MSVSCEERLIYYGYPMKEDIQKANVVLSSVSGDSSYSDINDVLEIYHAQLTLEHSDAGTTLAKKIVHEFFKEKLTDEYCASVSICQEYVESFWECLSSFNVYKNLSPKTLITLLEQTNTPLYMFCKHEKLVKYCDEQLAEYMRHSPQTAKLLISKFLELHRSPLPCHLPKSLQPREYEPILQTYIDSENPHNNRLDLLANTESTTEFPVSDELRLKAKQKSEYLWENARQSNSLITEDLGAEVIFADEPEEISGKPSKKVSPDTYMIRSG